MKKILKYSIFVLILFLGFSTNVFGVKTTKKDFCASGPNEFMFACDQVEMECKYSPVEFDFYSNVYINIHRSGLGNVSFGDRGVAHNIDNWYDKGKLSITGIEIYNQTKACPKYVIRAVSVFYVSDDKHIEEDSKNAGTIQGKYELKSITINTYNSINESEKKEENSQFPDVDSCAGFKSEEECKVGITADNDNFGCAWNKDYKFCSANGLVYLSCGSGDTVAYDIPVMAPQLTSYAITALKTVTPVILIIMGMFQLIKAITSQNEDEMKKARGSLIKKLIAAVIIFFMVSIVQFVIGKVADTSEQESLSSCLSCFLNNDCGRNFYYTDGYGNCYNVSDNQKRDCPVDNY